VLERAGQTEAAIDLARLAGLHPSGVICEIMNKDGTMARVPQLSRSAELRHSTSFLSDLSISRCGERRDDLSPRESSDRRTLCGSELLCRR
jgi:3,4-dihydroxy 2-butanone 4-phosphate synthase / GTP cyclohydrolase II